MRIELLHISDCPNWEETSRRLRLALDAIGCADVTVEATLVDSAESAERVPFAGSPTILIDGDDLFPSKGRTADLACRVYLTPEGFAGSPTRTQIDEALTSRR